MFLFVLYVVRGKKCFLSAVGLLFSDQFSSLKTDIDGYERKRIKILRRGNETLVFWCIVDRTCKSCTLAEVRPQYFSAIFICFQLWWNFQRNRKMIDIVKMWSQFVKFVRNYLFFLSRFPKWKYWNCSNCELIELFWNVNVIELKIFLFSLLIRWIFHCDSIDPQPTINLKTLPTNIQ